PFVHLLGLVACMFIESRRPAGTTTCLLSFAGGDHKNKGRKAFPPVIPRDRPGMSGHRPLTRSVRMARRAAMGACSVPRPGCPGKSAPSADCPDQCIGHNTGVPL